MIGWGILGTGRAARDFAAGLRYVPGARLAAIGSRSAAAAEEFARVAGAARACASYEELVTDSGVDVVYVATPYALHKRHSLLALEAGKALLCEKPFASDAGEALEVIGAARRRRLFCMEAMWMHFLPGMQKAMELIARGAIGEPRLLIADFGVPTPGNRQSGPFNARLGGGAMMDRGVYPLALAWRLFGKPERVEAMATLTHTGVDEHSSAMIRYPAGQIAMLSATLTGYAANQALISGTEGRIVIREPLCRPDRLTISRAPALPGDAHAGAAASLRRRLQANAWARKLRRFLPERARTLHLPYVGNGFNYEASEVVRCLGAGVLESPVWSLDQTAGVMHTLDLIRSRWLV